MSVYLRLQPWTKYFEKNHTKFPYPLPPFPLFNVAGEALLVYQSDLGLMQHWLRGKRGKGKIFWDNWIFSYYFCPWLYFPSPLQIIFENFLNSPPVLINTSQKINFVGFTIVISSTDFTIFFLKTFTVTKKGK